MKTGHAKTWQTDSRYLNSDTGKIAVWHFKGWMLTANCTQERARHMVDTGKAFVISSTSIGHYEPSLEDCNA